MKRAPGSSSVESAAAETQPSASEGRTSLSPGKGRTAVSARRGGRLNTVPRRRAPTPHDRTHQSSGLQSETSARLTQKTSLPWAELSAPRGTRTHDDRRSAARARATAWSRGRGIQRGMGCAPRRFLRAAQRPATPAARHHPTLEGSSGPVKVVSARRQFALTATRERGRLDCAPPHAQP
jgi:hypothetical protein